MRFSVALFASSFAFAATLGAFSPEASAQDAAAISMQAVQMANQQAMDAAQQANQQAMQANQQAAQDAQDLQMFACCRIATPKLSVKPGAYNGPITLRMKDSTRGTAIYYTTDGWTPTTNSTRYTGPITLSATTSLQAVAVTGNNLRSQVLTAVYTLPGPAPEPPSTSFPANAPGSSVLMPGTVLPLVFTAAVNSKNLQVGDALPVALAQDLSVGGVVVADKSSPVLATVTQVDSSGILGLPGTLSFTVHSLTLNNGTILPLRGTKTKEGQPHSRRAMAVATIPVGGIFGALFVRGTNATIEAGASFNAVVAADTGNQARIAAGAN